MSASARRSIQRRSFLQLSAAALAAAGTSGRLLAQAAPFRVGVGHDSDPYAACMRALEASGDWNPNVIAGTRVVIKPNLVGAQTPESGTTTDPQVVRALVDLCLNAGAVDIRIVESNPNGVSFVGPGYEFFADYDAGDRVSLVNVLEQPVIPAVVPRGLAYRTLYLPALLFEPGTYFITAAKLKVHSLAQVTLTMKNAFGLPAPSVYARPAQPNGRHSMHDRSVSQSIIDLNLARMPDFAVVDGIWGMDRFGPLGGVPVRTDLVLAGRNALAVDLACLEAMSIPLSRVQHLVFAATLGLGPSDVSEIEMLGDPFTPRTFTLPADGSTVRLPRAVPTVFRPSANQSTWTAVSIDRPAYLRTQIARVSDDGPNIDRVRLLADWSARDAGRHVFPWDGRDDTGALVPPGLYAVHATTYRAESGVIQNGTGWVGVAP